MSTAAAAAPAGEAAKPKKGQKKLFLIIGLVVLLLAGAGGGWYYMSAKAAAEAEEEEEETPKKAETTKKAAEKKKKKKKGEKLQVEFMTIEPWFTFNLMDKDPERSGQIGLVFEIADKKAGEELKFRMPAVRSKILFLLSSKYAADLKTPEGKKKLQDEILAEARSVLGDIPETGIHDVHFSIFVVQ